MKFLSEVEGAFIRGTVNFKFSQPLVFKSDVYEKLLEIPIGFVTNFASIPGILLWFIDVISPEIRDGAAVHDYLYVNKIGSREMADLVLLECMIDLGASKTTAYLVFIGVRLGGRAHWGKPIR